MTTSPKKLLFPPPQFEGEKETTKKDYTFTNKLGDGAFGIVWKILHKKSNRVFACKQVAKERVVKMIEQFRREVLIMYQINHQNVIKLFHHFEDAKYFYLVMELAEGGNLFQKLAKDRRFSEEAAFCYFQQILSAVEYLHTRNPVIIHRDIKPENIIMDTEGNLKLTDFGWSNYYTDEKNPRYTVCGTYEYLCPEMVKETSHTPAVDIWCVGILLFEMVTGHTPFKAPSKEALMENISKGKIKFPSDISSSLRTLISQILNKNPSKRPSIQSIRSNEWFVTKSKKASAKPANQTVVKPQLNSSNSYRSSIVTLKEEISARQEIVKILKTQIKVANETISKNEKLEKDLESKILTKKKEAFRLEENNKQIKEKIEDLKILERKIIEMQQKDQLTKDLSSRKEELDLKNLKISQIKKSIVDSQKHSDELIEKYEDKLRYFHNLNNYLKKIKTKGTNLHQHTQLQISDLQIAYDCIKSKIKEADQKLKNTEKPENKPISELISFIKQNKQKILDIYNFEDKLKVLEDNLSLKEFELEKIKIEYLDNKKKIIKESWAFKEKIKNAKNEIFKKKSNLEDLLRRELDESRSIEKKIQFNQIDVLHAKDKIKVLRGKIDTVFGRIAGIKGQRERLRKVIKEKSSKIENIEMDLGFLKSRILDMCELNC